MFWYLSKSCDSTSCNIGERCVYIYKGPECFTGTAAFSMMPEPVRATSPAAAVTYHQVSLSSRLPVSYPHSPDDILSHCHQKCIEEPQTEDAFYGFIGSTLRLLPFDLVKFVLL